MEFKEFEPRFKSAKTRFKLSAGLNLETFEPRLKFKPPLKFFKFGYRFQIYTFGACNTLGQIQTVYTRQAGTSKCVSSMICTSLVNPCTGLDNVTIVLRIFRNYLVPSNHKFLTVCTQSGI